MPNELVSPGTAVAKGLPTKTTGADESSEGTALPNFPNVAGRKTCRSCGLENAADADTCARCRKALVGNRLAVTSGIYAVQKPAGVVEDVEELKAAIVTDLGGESELTTLERAYVGHLGDVEVTLQLLMQDIEARGLLTPVGGVRRVYDQLLSGIDRWDKLAQRLGLKRRTKRVPTIDEYVRQKAPR